MQRSAGVRLRTVCLGIGVSLLLAGCAGGQRPAPSPSQTATEAPVTTSQTVTESTATNAIPVTGTASDWIPPLFVSPEEEAAYYVSRLADRRFVTSYGSSDSRRPWYIAAERLGEIGFPAVPLLFSRLNTNDEYELMLVLYALQLATQDPQLLVRTRGEYVQLNAVLDPAHNAENVDKAQQWWQQHANQLNL